LVTYYLPPTTYDPTYYLLVVFSSQILRKRLQSWCESRGVLEPEQAGFREKKSTIEHIFTLAEIIKRRRKERKDTYCCFLDIRKAYDKVWREGLWQRMEEIGIGGKIYAVIREMYRKTESCIQMEGGGDQDGMRLVRG